MAEALGLAATVVQLSAAAAQIARQIRLLREAPIEILSLANEVSDISFVITELEELESQRGGSVYENLAFTRILRNIREKIEELEEFTNTIAPKGVSKISDRVKWLHRRRKALALSNDLARIKNDLNLTIGSMTA